jgi:hypothetical protein
MIKSFLINIRNSFREPGNFTWQWRWASWWSIWPHYRVEDEVMDYGVPEYAHLYPHYQVNWFCFSCFQSTWLSNYASPDAEGN